MDIDRALETLKFISQEYAFPPSEPVEEAVKLIEAELTRLYKELNKARKEVA